VDSKPGSFIRVPRQPRSSPGDGQTGETPRGGSRVERDGHRNEEPERLVIPRQDRDGGSSRLDVELREVRFGHASRGPYLRVVPARRTFARVGQKHFEATQLASAPQTAFGRAIANLKALVLGRPIATASAIHERLSKVKALAVLGSDPLSSSAYATEEALIILAAAGTGALIYSLPIAAVVAALMAVVVISYRQTQKAYPSGGGAYIVAHENLGPVPGLIAGSSLIVDYVLLVSVSVAAGVAAVTSAIPELFDWRVELSLIIIVVFTLGNLRGIRESGSIFAAPTYFFIGCMGIVIVAGLVKVIMGNAPGSLLHAAPPREELVATQGLNLWLILRAFSSGGAALTGVEAMSNNIPNFKPPESRNARTTLTVMAVIAISFFIGITFLTSRFGLVPTHDETLVSQLGRTVLGDNFLYFAYQASTAMVLFLAANTSFYDFPLLSAIMARDKYMPRQFTFRGDRLAYSHGIIVLAAVASLLLVVYQANTTRLIPLYAVGVFVSFTLSQSGMVVHWLRLKEPGWRASLVMNAAGAIATGVVAVIIGATKFTHGAWISMLMMAVLAITFLLIRRHYDWFARRIRMDETTPAASAPVALPLEPGKSYPLAVIPVDDVNRITLGAVALAREITPRITAVNVAPDRKQAEAFRVRWEKAVPDVQLFLVESPFRVFAGPIMAFIQKLHTSNPTDSIVLVLPAFRTRHWWEKFLHNRDVLRLERAAEGLPRTKILIFTYDLA
jgi:amino acid transporter